MLKIVHLERHTSPKVDRCSTTRATASALAGLRRIDDLIRNTTQIVGRVGSGSSQTVSGEDNLRYMQTVLAASIAVLAAGCGSSKKSSTAAPAASTPSSSTAASTTATTAHVGAPGAKVSFVSPKAGASVTGPVLVTVKITGFTLDPKDVGKAARQGFGHLHFSMDDGKYDYPKYSGANGKLAVTLGVQGKYSPSVTPHITYKGLPKGTHKLEVYLANNDHTNTGVEASTTFTET